MNETRSQNESAVRIPYRTDEGVVIAVDLDGTVHRARVEPSDSELSKLANDAHHAMVDGGAEWYGFSHQRDAWESGYFDGYRARAAVVVGQASRP